MSKQIRSCAIYKDLIIESAEDYTVTNTYGVYYFDFSVKSIWKEILFIYSCVLNSDKFHVLEKRWKSLYHPNLAS